MYPQARPPRAAWIAWNPDTFKYTLRSAELAA